MKPPDIPRLTLVAAMDEHRVIAKPEGGIPWHLPDDISHFRALTKDTPLLLGRRTFEEMRGWFSGQRAFVLTSHPERMPRTDENAAISFHKNLDEAMKTAKREGCAEVVVVGGASVFEATMPLAHRLELTHVHTVAGPGPKFPEVDPQLWCGKNLRHHSTDADHAQAFDFASYVRATC